MHRFQGCSFSIQMKLCLQYGFVYFQARDIEEVESRHRSICVEISALGKSLRHCRRNERGVNEARLPRSMKLRTTLALYGFLPRVTPLGSATLLYNSIINCGGTLRRPAFSPLLRIPRTCNDFIDWLATACSKHESIADGILFRVSLLFTGSRNEQIERHNSRYTDLLQFL